MSMFPQSQSVRRPLIEIGEREKSLLHFFNAVYAWMAVGIAVTTVVGLLTSQSQAMMNVLYGSRGLIAIFALGLFVISIATQRVALQHNAALGTVLFLIYSALMGLFISGIFVVYKMSTLVGAFGVTGGVFGVMSLYGYITKRDLTTIGSYLIMAAIGLFIASLVNLFFASSALSWFITYAVLLVFLGITAYETQKLKVYAIQFEDNPQMLARLAVVGSLMLYISFINLFLSILRIMGGNRR